MKDVRGHIGDHMLWELKINENKGADMPSRDGTIVEHKENAYVDACKVVKEQINE